MEGKKTTVFTEHLRGVFPMTYLRSNSDVPADTGVVAVNCMVVKSQMKGIGYKDPMQCVYENMNIDHSRLFKSYLN